VTPAGVDWVFYDGTCGLCHAAVRWAVETDQSGDAFRFAPLGGTTFQINVPESKDLPDSIVVLTAGGQLLAKSSAVVHMMLRLGGGWRRLGILLRLVPRPVRDLAYDAVARLRRKLFRKPESACPMLPPHLRARFDP